MATKVTIIFELPEDKYNEYEECIEEFESNLQDIGITDIDVTEDDDSKSIGQALQEIKDAIESIEKLPKQ